MTRFFAWMPILACALALGKATGDPALATLLASMTVVAAAIGPRWELDRGRQIVTSAMGAGAAYALVGALYDRRPPYLDEGWTRVAAMALLAAAARLVIVRPRGGWTATTALAFVSLVAAGETHVGGYAAFVTLFLLTSLVARPGSGRVVDTTPARAGVGAAILAAAAAVAVAAMGATRLAYAWISARERATALAWTPRVGFSDSMDLGALEGLLDSDTVVLRVRGPRVDYLRGAVLDTYVAGRWTRSEAVEAEEHAAFDGDAPGRERVEITAVAERTDRFFLPLDARRLVTSPAAVRVDRLGAVKRETKHGLISVRFVVGERDRAPVAPATDADLELPARIRPALERLAAQWTRGTTTRMQQIAAIERAFATDFHYARTFRPARGADPALDFLLRVRSGHCEYFATGMALVARAAKIPARVVVGYRVAERSPLGYFVVRERNAHAWVELQMPDGRWATHDATPGDAVPQNLEHDAGYAASALDALRVAYDEATERLARLSVAQTAFASSVGVLVLLWVVARGARRRAAAPRSATIDGVPRGLAVLLSTLERAGHAHPEHEPLERLAARVPESIPAALVARYAALRYGGVGDPDALDADVRAYVERTGPRSPPGARRKPFA